MLKIYCPFQLVNLYAFMEHVIRKHRSVNVTADMKEMIAIHQYQHVNQHVFMELVIRRN
jgi:hypothetical protein